MNPRRRLARASRLLVVLSGLVGLAAMTPACSTPPPKTGLNYTADAKRAYEAALAEFQAHNWLEAMAAFREVKRKYSYSRYARLAELRLADADFEQDKFAEAIRGYKQFVHDHRGNADEVTYARARIAEAQYREITDSILLPTSEERDQGSALEAYKEMRGFLHDFPEAKQSQRVCELLEDVTIKLVRHELYVARFYLQRDNFDATVSRVQYALRNYASDPPCPNKETASAKTDVEAPTLQIEADPRVPDFGLAPEALLLLGETYLKMHRWTDARTSFSVLTQRYPGSALVVQANGFLEFMKKHGV